MSSKATPGNSQIAIGGLRFSEELIQVGLTEAPGGASLRRLLTQLADKKLSIAYLQQSTCSGRLATSLGLARRHLHVVEQAMLAEGGVTTISLQKEIGSLTLFPHRQDPGILSTLLSVMAEAELPLYGYSSSISGLTISTDFGRLDLFAEHLQHHFQLPPNHAPFRPQFRLEEGEKLNSSSPGEPETIAVYWEEQIKVYGISYQTDLLKYQFVIPTSDLNNWVNQLQKLSGESCRFYFCQALPLADGQLLLDLVLPASRAGNLFPDGGPATALPVANRRGNAAVGCLFHGPHFQDRYGIAEALLSGLYEAAILPMAVGLSGTSAYLLSTPEDHPNLTRALDRTFVLPEGSVKS